jgi:hypothetical protein
LVARLNRRFIRLINKRDSHGCRKSLSVFGQNWFSNKIER